MENYENVPQSLYGLTPSQLDMFMTEDNPVRRQSELVTEVLFSFDLEGSVISINLRIHTQLKRKEKETGTFTFCWKLSIVQAKHYYCALVTTTIACYLAGKHLIRPQLFE